MEYNNHLFGIVAVMAVLILAGIWLAWKVVTLRSGLEIPLGLGAIATGLVSLSIIALSMPEQFAVSAGCIALTILTIVVVGLRTAKNRKIQILS